MIIRVVRNSRFPYLTFKWPSTKMW